MRTFLDAIHQANRFCLLNGRLRVFFVLFFLPSFLRRSGASAGLGIFSRGTGGDRFRRRRKGRVRKSFIKIHRQNIVPVRGYAEIGIRLSPSRTDHREKFILLERMNPLDRQRSHARLLPLLNHETDEQISLFAFVVVFDLRLDLGIQKSICLIKRAHR